MKGWWKYCDQCVYSLQGREAWTGWVKCETIVLMFIKAITSLEIFRLWRLLMSNVIFSLCNIYAYGIIMTKWRVSCKPVCRKDVESACMTEIPQKWLRNRPH